MGCCHSTHSLLFGGCQESHEGSAAICDPDHARPFARYRCVATSTGCFLKFAIMGCFPLLRARQRSIPLSFSSYTHSRILFELFSIQISHTTFFECSRTIFNCVSFLFHRVGQCALLTSVRPQQSLNLHLHLGHFCGYIIWGYLLLTLTLLHVFELNAT